MAHDHETWYAAQGTWALPTLVTWWSLIDLYLFYSKVKSGHLGFCMGKRQTVHFSEAVVAYEVKVDICNQQIRFFYDYQSTFIDLYPGCLSFSCFIFFISKTLSWLKPNYILEPLDGGMKVCSWDLGHIIKMATMPIYGKNLWKSSQELNGLWLWNLVCTNGYSGSTTFVQMVTLGWHWHFMARSNLFS